jgi:DNA-binding response OmpR family regulator
LCADDVRPDVAIVELQLVAHSGIEFLYEFRSYVDWQNIPVVALTTVPPGEFAGSSRLLTDELGVKVYHYKPVTSLAKLLASVHELTAAKVA